MNAAAWLAVLLGWGLLSWLFLGVTRLAAQADRETERAFQTMIRQQRGKEDTDGRKPPEVCGG